MQVVSDIRLTKGSFLFVGGHCEGTKARRARSSSCRMSARFLCAARGRNIQINIFPRLVKHLSLHVRDAVVALVRFLHASYLCGPPPIPPCVFPPVLLCALPLGNISPGHAYAPPPPPRQPSPLAALPILSALLQPPPHLGHSCPHPLPPPRSPWSVCRPH